MPAKGVASPPETAAEWLAVALREHRAASGEAGGRRRRHLDAARVAYQQVLDLCDAHCLAPAVRGLGALSAQEAGEAARGPSEPPDVEVLGRLVRRSRA